jgi:glycolate oxidase
MPMLFTDDDMEVMARLRDVFDPRSILNPQKVLPTTRSCREVKAADFPGVVA